MNTQTPEKIDYDPEGSLDVVDIFYSIQGEGPLVGTPAVFIRLAGCNLQCRFCDTNYTVDRVKTPFKELTEIVKRYRVKSDVKQRPLVVLTGGEPFRQNIEPLVFDLVKSGYKVQIETNGTISPRGVHWSQLRPSVDIICSPKTGDDLIDNKIREWVDAVKYVIDVLRVDGQDGLPKGLARFFNTPTFVQPMDSEDYNRNVKAAVDSCLKFGYRLSLQVHKIVGVQ